MKTNPDQFQRVICKSGTPGTRRHLKDDFDCYGDFASQCDMTCNHERLGFPNPMAAWRANPLIESSVNTGDYRVVTPEIIVLESVHRNLKILFKEMLKKDWSLFRDFDGCGKNECIMIGGFIRISTFMPRFGKTPSVKIEVLNAEKTEEEFKTNKIMDVIHFVFKTLVKHELKRITEDAE